jgi:hypothetical protein
VQGMLLPAERMVWHLHSRWGLHLLRKYYSDQGVDSGAPRLLWGDMQR